MNLKFILETLEEAGYSPTRYSGRGMGGKYCVGVVVSENPFDVLLNIVSEMYEGVDLEAIGSCIDDLVEDLKDAQTDRLGHDSILYFPNLKWEDEKEFDDD